MLLTRVDGQDLSLVRSTFNSVNVTAAAVEGDAVAYNPVLVVVGAEGEFVTTAHKHQKGHKNNLSLCVHFLFIN